MFKTKNELHIDGAILVANPIPEEYEVPYEKWRDGSLKL